MNRQEAIAHNEQAVASGNFDAVVEIPAEDQPANGGAGDGGAGGGDATQFDFAKESDGFFTDANDFKTKIKTFRERFENLNTIADELTNPIPEPLRPLAGVMKKLGIQDENTARLIANTDAEQEIQKDPVRVIALAKVIQNPEILKTLKFEQVFNGLRQNYQGVVEENSETGEVKYNNHDAVLLDAVDAAKIISTSKEKLNESTDIFALAEQKRTERAQKTTEAAQAWQGPEVQQQLSKIAQISIPFGDKAEQGFVYTPTQEMQKKAIEFATKSLSAQGVLPNAEGLQSFQDLTDIYLWRHDRARIVATAMKQNEGAVKEAANKFFHNLEHIDRSGSAGAGGASGMTKEEWGAAVLDTLAKNQK